MPYTSQEVLEVHVRGFEGGREWEHRRILRLLGWKAFELEMKTRQAEADGGLPVFPVHLVCVQAEPLVEALRVLEEEV